MEYNYVGFFLFTVAGLAIPGVVWWINLRLEKRDEKRWQERMDQELYGHTVK
ncbi:MAG: hypothetical protein JF606_29220 [Burkholderiales bacterium]|jgi:hypothetical protein|nr:hypothetical protein [Burkholderiales bacterium]